MVQTVVQGSFLANSLADSLADNKVSPIKKPAEAGFFLVS